MGSKERAQHEESGRDPKEGVMKLRCRVCNRPLSEPHDDAWIWPWIVAWMAFALWCAWLAHVGGVL